MIEPAPKTFMYIQFPDLSTQSEDDFGFVIYLVE